MKVWSDAVLAAAKGATAGTYDSIGTVTIKKGAKSVIGFQVLAIASTPTSGLSGMPILQVDSSDLGISKQRFALANVDGDGIATNDKESPVYAEFIPFKVDPGKSLDNAKIDFSITSNVSKTGGYDVAVGVVYADQEPDLDFVIELKTGSCARATGGAHAEQDAGISAVTSTPFTTGISITSTAKELIGLLGVLVANAPTAGENAVAVVEFSSSQIDNFSPQIWVMPFGYNASLGTPVGTPISASMRNGFYHPTRFPLPEVNFTMDVSMKLAVALSNAADGVAAAKWR